MGVRTCCRLKSGFDVLRPPSHFLLLAQEKVTKENGTLRPSSLRACGAPGTRVGPGFSTGLLP